MRIKSMPASLFLLCLTLGFVVFIGTVATAVNLGRWRIETIDISILRIVISAALLVIVPLASIRAIIKKRKYGFYLGLLPLLVFLGFSLRLVSIRFASQISSEGFGYDIYNRMATLGFAIALGTFIIKLGFSKTVAAYFESDSLN